jgi:hypothetical protein
MACGGVGVDGPVGRKSRRALDGFSRCRISAPDLSRGRVAGSP